MAKKKAKVRIKVNPQEDYLYFVCRTLKEIAAALDVDLEIEIAPESIPG